MQKIVKVHYLLDKEDKKKIKYWLINNEKSMRQLAQDLYVSASWLCEILKGTRYVTQDMLDKFKELGIDLGE